jgi:hypothetical protein
MPAEGKPKMRIPRDKQKPTDPQVGYTPVIYDEHLECFLKLEYTNPSGSHKDRETYWIINKYGRDKHYLIVSEGNAGISGAYWMRDHALILVPEGRSDTKLNIIKQFEATVQATGKYYFETYKRGEQISEDAGIIDASPGELERWKGDVPIAYELMEWRPDYVFIPAANMNLSYATAYGFQELVDKELISIAPIVIACVLPNHPLSPLKWKDIDEKYQKPFDSIYTHGPEGKDIKREFQDLPHTKIDTTRELDAVLDLCLRYPNYDPVDMLAMHISRNYKGVKICVVTGIRRY